ncbi:MAG: ATP-grasp domain-containing protein [Oscillospiraceae bacterium]|nr:ATP-grasp domain-containing protein [Oscillospiraceae bacterium]
MKNVIFMSPNFPTNYWHFCHELRNNGVRVLGIGDQAYDTLPWELRDSLTEYYKVDSLENYDEAYRAVAFFIFKYGRIDFLESNNEYWLEQDAALRTDFNIPNGFRNEDVARIKYKSGMKEYYRRAGIPTARYHLADDLAGCRAFAAEVGYPIVAKPDNGVGANGACRINSDEELQRFLLGWDGQPYILEEFIRAEIQSYDAIYNSRGEPIFEAGNISPISVMDIVNNNDNCAFYIRRELPEDMREAGRATAKSFGVKSRFIHFEFFRLTEDQHIGRKGQIVALEVNMRPSGGFSPDMINFAHSTNVYKIWADMVAFDRSDMPEGEHNFCAFAGRRDGRSFRLSHEEVLERYGASLRMVGRMPDALSGAMGNQMYLATFPTQEALDLFYEDVLSPE